MKKLVMLAREITEMEIKQGIGTERSSTRLVPIFKTLNINIPIHAGKKYTPAIPINPQEGTPMLSMPLLYIPHHESYLFGTPSIIDKSMDLKIQPTKLIQDPGKGTASPIIATAIEAKDDDILILSPCDQYHSEAVTDAVSSILEKIEKNEYESGTVLTTGTKNPAFSYIRVKGDDAVEFMLKGTIPKEDMIAETMIVCCKSSYLKKQISYYKDASIKDLKKIYPYTNDEIKTISELLKDISLLIDSCNTTEEYLEKCSFCDFSKVIHRLLIPQMTYATVKYQTEWDDLGDWVKIYNSSIYPKDEDGNIIFSQPGLLSYKNCENSIIANFTDSKMIVDNIKKRIVAIGPRGMINIPLKSEPSELKEKVVKLQM